MSIDMFAFSTLYQAGISSLVKLSLEGGAYFGFRALVICLEIKIQHNSNYYCESTLPQSYVLFFFSYNFFFLPNVSQMTVI